MTLSTENIAGYSVAVANTDRLAASICDWVSRSEHSCRWLACLNPHSYAVSLERPAFAAALRDADWLIPDGVGVVIASRFLGGSIRERITGSDVFHAINARAAVTGKRVFLLGSTKETLTKIREQMAIDWPQLVVAGAYSPPFRAEFTPEDEAEMIEAVNVANADILWVGLTAPKQEIWLYQNHEKLRVAFAAGIGAVFDFYTGQIKRSSPTMQRLGLEWLPRLLQEPKRLWRRTFVSAPIFAAALLREKISGSGT